MNGKQAVTCYGEICNPNLLISDGPFFQSNNQFQLSLNANSKFNLGKGGIRFGIYYEEFNKVTSKYFLKPVNYYYWYDTVVNSNDASCSPLRLVQSLAISEPFCTGDTLGLGVIKTPTHIKYQDTLLMSTKVEYWNNTASKWIIGN